MYVGTWAKLSIRKVEFSTTFFKFCSSFYKSSHIQTNLPFKFSLFISNLTSFSSRCRRTSFSLSALSVPSKKWLKICSNSSSWKVLGSSQKWVMRLWVAVFIRLKLALSMSKFLECSLMAAAWKNTSYLKIEWNLLAAVNAVNDWSKKKNRFSFNLDMEKCTLVLDDVGAHTILPPLRDRCVCSYDYLVKLKLFLKTYIICRQTNHN